MYADDTKANEKQSMAAQILTRVLPNNLRKFTTFDPASVYSANIKRSDSKQEYVKLPVKHGPTFAGEAEAQAVNKPAEDGLNNNNSPSPEKQDQVTANSLFRKLAVVLSPVLMQEIENEQAMQQAREAQRMPKNVGLRQTPPTVNSIMPPMGMTQPAPNLGQIQPAQPAQPQQPQQPQQPANGQLASVGGGGSPNSNPINAFGGLSSAGDINGNAALGTRNMAGGEKMSAGELNFLRPAPKAPQSFEDSLGKSLINLWWNNNGKKPAAPLSPPAAAPVYKHWLDRHELAKGAAEKTSAFAKNLMRQIANEFYSAHPRDLVISGAMVGAAGGTGLGLSLASMAHNDLDAIKIYTDKLKAFNDEREISTDKLKAFNDEREISRLTDQVKHYSGREQEYEMKARENKTLQQDALEAKTQDMAAAQTGFEASRNNASNNANRAQQESSGAYNDLNNLYSKSREWLTNPRLWAGVGVGALGAYGLKKVYDRYRRPKQEKTSKCANCAGVKTAYGYGDEHVQLERYLDGGFVDGMKNDEAAAFTRRIGELAKKQDLNLRFSPARYEIGNDDAETAAQRLQDSKDLNNYDDQTLPYYYSLETKEPNFLRRMFGAKRPELDYDNHPINTAWNELNQAKKSASTLYKQVKQADVSLQRVLGTALASTGGGLLLGAYPGWKLQQASEAAGNSDFTNFVAGKAPIAFSGALSAGLYNHWLDRNEKKPEEPENLAHPSMQYLKYLVH